MPQIKMTCAICRRTIICVSARRGKVGIAGVAAKLSEQGWSSSVVSGVAICSEECRAAMARDVTPVCRGIGSDYLGSQ